MMLKSFVMLEARTLVSNEGKDALMNEINISKIIGTALLKQDIALNKPIQSKEYYSKKALAHKDNFLFLEEFKYFYFNINVKNYDTNLNIEEKRKILHNSVKILEPLIKDLKDNYDYNDFIN